MQKIIVKSEDELIELTKELWHVLVNLRYWTNEWQKEHGAILLEHKKKWEARADELIKTHGLQKTNASSGIEISLTAIGEEKQQRPMRWRQKSESLYELKEGKYSLQVIRIDDFNCYWDVSYDGQRIANCDIEERTPTTVKQAKDAARWRMEKHKDSLIRKTVNNADRVEANRR